VNEAFGSEAKADTLRMVHEIEGSLEQDVNTLTWMTDATKKQAAREAARRREQDRLPGSVRDYSALKIVRGDALGNSQRANVFEFKRQMGKIGRALDKSEWT